MPYENNAEGVALMESHVAIVISYISPFGVWATTTIETRVNSANSDIDVRKVLYHMSDFGWLVFRYDIYDIGVALPENPHIEVVSFQLTDEGRILKALGDIPSYHSYIENRHNEERRRQQLNDTLLENNLINGTITKRLYVATAWIAVATVVAGTYYTYMIQVQVKKDHPHFYKQAFPLVVTFEMTCAALTISLLLIYILKNFPISNKK